MSSVAPFITQYVREASVASVYKNLRKFGSKFGVEIEVASPCDWESVRRSLVPIVGARNIADRAGGYGTSDNSYSKWQVTSDSSIRHNGGYGVELISPAFNIQTEADVSSVSALIQKVFDHLKSIGCKTNSSTGLHITMSCAGLSPSRFRPYVFCALADELNLVRAFGRTRNTYCKPTTLTVRDMRLDFRKSDAHKALCSSQASLNERGKYMSVNTSKLRRNTPLIEYRGVGGDYLNKITAADLVGIAARLSASLVTATHFNAEDGAIQAFTTNHMLRALREYNASSVTYSALLFDDTVPVDEEQFVALKPSFAGVLPVPHKSADVTRDLRTQVEVRVIRKAGFTDTEPARDVQIKVASHLTMYQGRGKLRGGARELTGRWAGLSTTTRNIERIKSPALRVAVARAVYQALCGVPYAEMLRRRNPDANFMRDDLTYCFRRVRAQSSIMDKIRELAQLQS